MANETVQIFVVDQNGIKLDGVLVRVFDAAGTALIAEGTSAIVGSDAIADFTLDGDDPPVGYTVRLSKTGVGFNRAYGDEYSSPQAIDVWSPATSSPTGTNNFTVRGETFVRPVSGDPRLCRCSGFIRDQTGAPLSGVVISFVNQFRPLLVDGDLILGERVFITSDKNGYVELDLYRESIYEACVLGIEAATPDGLVATREVHVPDTQSFNLSNLLFPVVGSVSWSPTAVSVAVGSYVDVTPTIKGTDDRVLSGVAEKDVVYTSVDPTIANAFLNDGLLRVSGLSVGTTEIRVTRKDSTIDLIPDSSYVEVPLLVTVT